MNQAFASQPRADTGLHHQICSTLLQYSGAHALLDIFLGASLHHDGFNAL